MILSIVEERIFHVWSFSENRKYGSRLSQTRYGKQTNLIFTSTSRISATTNKKNLGKHRILMSQMVSLKRFLDFFDPEAFC